MTIYEPFVPTAGGLITVKLRLAHIQPGDRLFDLGCGDGRVLIEAARNFKAECVGYEIRPDLAEQAQEAVHRSGLADRVTIVRGDLMKADISSADALVLYLSQEVIASVASRLGSELPRGARVVTHTFGLPGWRPVRHFRLRATGRHIDDLFLYVTGVGDENSTGATSEDP